MEKIRNFVTALLFAAIASLSGSALAAPQSLTILGSTGAVGTADQYVEYFDPFLGTWGAAYSAGIHPWGLVTGTSSWINYRTNLNGSASCLPATPCKSTYRVRFTAPTSWANTRMSLSVMVDDEAVISLNGTQLATAISDVTYKEETPLIVVDTAFGSALRAGENILTFEVTDFQGLTGINFRIDLSAEAPQAFVLTPAGAPPAPILQTMTMFGSAATSGTRDLYTEFLNPATGTYEAAYLAGVHPYGMVAGTTNWLSVNATPGVGISCTRAAPCTYRIRFSAPSAMTNPQISYEVRGEDDLTLKLNGAVLQRFSRYSGLVTEVPNLATALQAGTNTLTFEVAGNGVNFWVKFTAGTTSTGGSFSVTPAYQPPPPPPPPVLIQQNLSVFGSAATSGTKDLYVEFLNPATGSYEAAYLAGVHPYGIVAGTTNWLSVTAYPSPGSVTNCTREAPCQYRVRFTAPSTLVNPQMSYEARGEDDLTLKLNGVVIQSFSRYSGLVSSVWNLDTVIRPGANTLTFDVAGFGVNFWVKLSASTTTTGGTFTLTPGYQPPPPPPPPPDFTVAKTADQCKKDGWKVVYRADHSLFKNQGDCMQYVNTGK